MSVPPNRPPDPPRGGSPEETPTRAFAPAEPVRPVPAGPPEPAFWSLDSLRTGLALVAVLAVAALAVAVWALLRDHNARRTVVGPGPAPAQLAPLTREVQTLSAEVRALRSSSAAASRNASAAHSGLGQLSRSTSARLAGKASTQQLSRLQAQVNKLSSELSQLRSSEKSETTTQTTTTTTTGG